MDFHATLKRRDRLAADARAILDNAKSEERDITREEEGRFDGMMSEVDKLDIEIERERVRRGDELAAAGGDDPPHDPQPGDPDRGRRDGGDGVVTRQTQVLESGQRFTDWAGARGLHTPDVSLRQIIRGLTFGQWDRGAEDAVAQALEADERAFGSQIGEEGGYLVPAGLSAEIFDLVRAETRVIQAGARTVPMPTAEYSIGKIESDPTPVWRSEGANFTESSGTIGQIKLVAKGLGVLTKLPFELIQDAAPDAEDLVNSQVRSAIALEIDRVALLGDGDGGQPVGLSNTANVPTTALAGSPADWDFVVDRVGQVEDANFAVSAAITSPRVGRQFAKLKTGIAGDNTSLKRPERIEKLRWLETTQIPTDLGAGSDESLFMVGQWNQLLIGLRLELGLQILRERFADEGKVGVIAFTRLDIAIARPTAFAVETAII